jgi:hypothetical protein
MIAQALTGSPDVMRKFYTSLPHPGQLAPPVSTFENVPLFFKDLLSIAEKLMISGSDLRPQTPLTGGRRFSHNALRPCNNC